MRVGTKEEWIVVQPTQESQCTLEPGAYRVIQRYPDGSVRVQSAGVGQVVVDRGDWVECEE